MYLKKFIKLIRFAVFIYLFLATSAMAGTAQYTYDNLNRLVQVQYDDGSSIQYTYDAAGNRLTKQVMAFHASAPAAGKTPRFLAKTPLIPDSFAPMVGMNPWRDAMPNLFLIPGESIRTS